MKSVHSEYSIVGLISHEMSYLYDHLWPSEWFKQSTGKYLSINHKEGSESETNRKSKANRSWKPIPIRGNTQVTKIPRYTDTSIQMKTDKIRMGKSNGGWVDDRQITFPVPLTVDPETGSQRAAYKCIYNTKWKTENKVLRLAHWLESMLLTQTLRLTHLAEELQISNCPCESEMNGNVAQIGFQKENV